MSLFLYININVFDNGFRSYLVVAFAGFSGSLTSSVSTVQSCSVQCTKKNQVNMYVFQFQTQAVFNIFLFYRLAVTVLSTRQDLVKLHNYRIQSDLVIYC